MLTSPDQFGGVFILEMIKVAYTLEVAPEVAKRKKGLSPKA
jgi:hypothetical protein